MGLMLLPKERLEAEFSIVNNTFIKLRENSHLVSLTLELVEFILFFPLNLNSRRVVLKLTCEEFLGT